MLGIKRDSCSFIGTLLNSLAFLGFDERFNTRVRPSTSIGAPARRASAKALM
jgi:hypothetical protein